MSPAVVVQPGGRLINGAQVTIGEAPAAWAAQTRLHQRMMQLLARGKQRNKVGVVHGCSTLRPAKKRPRGLSREAFVESRGL